MSPLRYAASKAKSVPKVRPTACKHDTGELRFGKRGKGADEQAFQRGINGRGDGSPRGFEDGDQREDQSANRTANHIAKQTRGRDHLALGVYGHHHAPSKGGKGHQ